MAHNWSVGDLFGRYELRASLGRGGMGQVFEAYDREKDRVVALKLLDAQLAADAAFRERFRRESYAAARLNEPHVIPIHDWGSVDGTLYIDMRLVRGRDLRTVLRQEHRLAPDRAVAIISQVASALDAAHAEGLIHRDVKPENVLLTDDDFAYLVDFGIVQLADRTGVTSVGGAIGSLASMAPERFDERPATPATDVYSLGCLLVECLTGAPAYRQDGTAALLRAHIYDPPPRPTDRLPMLPAGFDDVVATAMAKDPAARFPTAGAFARAARGALFTPPRTAGTRVSGQPGPGFTGPGSSGPGFTGPGFSGPGFTGPGFTGPGQPAARRGSAGRRGAIAAGVAAVIVLVGVAAWWFATGGFSSDGADEASTTIAFTTRVSGVGTTTAPEPSVTTNDPSTTTAAPTTTAVEPPPLNAAVPAAGERGFVDGLGPLCNGTEFARAIGTTAASRFLICENAAGDRYYNGMRMSDGADIQIDGAVDLGGGVYEVVNQRDDTRYRVGPAGLQIMRGGEELANESATAYAYRE